MEILSLDVQKENSRIHRRHLDATSLPNPNAQASGDLLQPMLKEDEDMTDLLSLGVKLIQDLVARVEEYLKKTFGKSDLTKLPS